VPSFDQRASVGRRLFEIGSEFAYSQGVADPHAVTSLRQFNDQFWI
jgi:hypothetical protein